MFIFYYFTLFCYFSGLCLCFFPVLSDCLGYHSGAVRGEVRKCSLQVAGFVQMLELLRRRIVVLLSNCIWAYVFCI